MEIFETEKKQRARIWKPFKKYHYLDEKLHKGARQFVGLINGELAAHTGVIQFPMRKGWKRIHRLVVLPDYQGIGIGVKFINEVSRFIKDEGFRVNLTTTTPALIYALRRNDKWNLIRKSRTGNSQKGWLRYKETSGERLHVNDSKNRITFSFNYKK